MSDTPHQISLDHDISDVSYESVRVVDGHKTTLRLSEKAWLQVCRQVIKALLADLPARESPEVIAALQCDIAMRKLENMMLRRELESAKAYGERCAAGCEKLSSALDRIDYACGEPNAQEVSDYCVHQNENAVVRRVVALLDVLRKGRADARQETEALQAKITSLPAALLDASPDQGVVEVIADGCSTRDRDLFVLSKIIEKHLQT